MNGVAIVYGYRCVNAIGAAVAHEDFVVVGFLAVRFVVLRGLVVFGFLVV